MSEQNQAHSFVGSTTSLPCAKCGLIYSASIHRQEDLAKAETAPSPSQKAILKDSSESVYPEFSLADLELWFHRVLDERLKYRTIHVPGTPTANGYAYAEIPDWELLQKRDLLRAAINGVNALLATAQPNQDRKITTGENLGPASASGSEIESARIAEIRERRAKITKPPWKAYHRVSPRGAHQQWHIGNEDGLCQITMHGYERDYNFIANAPADIDFLLSEVERLSALIPSNEQEKT